MKHQHFYCLLFLGSLSQSDDDDDDDDDADEAEEEMHALLQITGPCSTM